MILDLAEVPPSLFATSARSTPGNPTTDLMEKLANRLVRGVPWNFNTAFNVWNTMDL